MKKIKKYYPIGESQRVFLWTQLLPAKRNDIKELYAIRCFFGLVDGGDADALEQAWFMLLERNDAMRQKIVLKKMRICCYYDDFEAIPLERVQLDDSRDDIEQLLLEQNLPVPGPFKKTLYAAKLCLWRQRPYLLMCCNHVGSDGFSVGLIFKYLAEYYRDLTEGKVLLQKQIKTYSYHMQVDKQSDYASSEEYKIDKKYWLETFRRQKRYSLPVGRWSKRFDCQSMLLCLGLKHTLGLEKLSIETSCSPSILVLQMLALTIWIGSNQRNFGVISINHGRYSIPQKRTIGNLCNLLPVFFDIDQTESVEDFIVKGYLHFLNGVKHGRFIMNNQKETIWMMDRNLKGKGRKREGRIQDHFWFVYSPMDGIDFNGDSRFSCGILPGVKEPYGIYCALLREQERGLSLAFMYQLEKISPERMKDFTRMFLQIVELVLNDPKQSLETIKLKINQSN